MNRASNNSTKRLRLQIANIGPHHANAEINLDEPFQSNEEFGRLVFYADNGVGKSFISRIFRLVSTEKYHKTTDELLSFEKSEGKFVMSEKDGGKEKKLSVTLRRNQMPEIGNDTGYIFHVFNSDYVEENIKPRQYAFDDQIDGYILGKEQIDLSEIKEYASELNDEIKKSKDFINQEIELGKKELLTKGVRANQKEFGLMHFDRLGGAEPVLESRSFEKILEQIRTIEDIPDELNDVESFELKPDVSFLVDVINVLTESYSVKIWDNEFIKSIQKDENYRNFVTSGLGLLDDECNSCPFCKQRLGDEARSLIENYREFLEDKEAKLLNLIDLLTQQLTLLLNDVTRIERKVKDSIVYRQELAGYFPSIEKSRITALTIDSFKSDILLLQNNLALKKQNIGTAFLEAESTVVSIQSQLDQFSLHLDENKSTVKAINRIKNNWMEERRKLRAALCRSQYLRYRTKLANDYLKLQEVEDVLSSIMGEINLKENRTSVKDVVLHTLKMLLETFFGDKYSVDEKTHYIRFRDKYALNKAASVLSDGEKHVIAFCHYLASIHTIVETEADYDRLFFIIDDPISSMDYHFVYMIAQTLKDIGCLACVQPPGINKKIHMWILTHNTEFFNILNQHKSVNRAFSIKPGEMKQVNKNVIYLSYHSHLKDVLDIALGKEKPNHTTGNSLRHVIESLARFEFPKDKAMKEFYSTYSSFSANKYLEYLCNDLSHGKLRYQHPCSDDIMISACKIVKSHIEDRYKGQLTISKEL